MRPRLKRTIETVRSSAGDLYLLRPGGDGDLVIEQPERRARALLAALDGESSTEQLERRFGRPLVSSTLRTLGDFHALEDASDTDVLPPDERVRFDRQLRYFSDLAAPGLGASNHQDRLRNSRVALLGLGGLGSWAGYALVCCGIGELLLVDGDVVEPSNFNRQILYRERDVGRPKAAAAADALGAFSSVTSLRSLERRLESPEAVEDVVRDCDFVVNAVDWPAHDIERWVNAACFRVGVSVITMSHAPPVARVGPLYAPGRTGCFECQERSYRRSFPLYDEIVDQRRGRLSPAATLGPVCAFVGGQVALEALHLLTGLCPPATLGLAHLYDLRTMEVVREPVPRDPGCPVCGDYS
ncbi:MAG TPA: TOMM precursor leader peptide-binding protein [Thermoleophilaceae bacterium]|nr:TOMM precursor leader peptide-binding protein [Thermoleophilaceae bacterium]